MFEQYLIFLSIRLSFLSKAEARIAYAKYYSDINKIKGYDDFISSETELMFFSYVHQKEKLLEMFLNEYDQKKEEEIYLQYI